MTTLEDLENIRHKIKLVLLNYTEYNQAFDINYIKSYKNFLQFLPLYESYKDNPTFDYELDIDDYGYIYVDFRHKRSEQSFDIWFYSTYTLVSHNYNGEYKCLTFGNYNDAQKFIKELFKPRVQ